MTGTPLLQINDLHVHFPIGGGLLGRNKRLLRAVSGVLAAFERRRMSQHRR